MATHTIRNTAGATVAVLNESSTTDDLFPIELVGEGVMPYAHIIASTQYHMLEHFAGSTEPVEPVEGMIWYDTSRASPTYYDGTEFVPISGISTNNASLFAMKSSANGINMASAHTVSLFTDPNVGNVYYPTSIMLMAVGNPTASVPAMFNLLVKESEDVLEGSTIALSKANQCATFAIQGTTQGITSGDSLQLEITSPATGNLTVNAYVFGFRV